MATNPAFANTPIIDVGQVTTANTNRDGTGTIVTIASGTTNGKFLQNVQIKHTSTSAAGMVRFFVSPDGGATNRLYTEVPVTAITPGSNVATFETTVPILVGLTLPGTAALLRASTQNTEVINIIVSSGSL